MIFTIYIFSVFTPYTFKSDINFIHPFYGDFQSIIVFDISAPFYFFWEGLLIDITQYDNYKK